MSQPPQDMKAFNRQLIEAFRASGGKGELGPVHFEHLVVLTTTGRRSGVPHAVPLGSARDDAGNLILFGSNMGAAKEPDWVANIRANPHVTAEITGRTVETDAEILTGGERDDAYRRWIELAPHTAGHEEQAGRAIPMIRVPVSTDAAQ
jgi:deazaflavin-dependent oxidoreductase (nitroreductase family)